MLAHRVNCVNFQMLRMPENLWVLSNMKDMREGVWVANSELHV